MQSVNEPGSLAQIAQVIAEHDGNIDNIRMTRRAPDFTDVLIDLEVYDLKHLNAIIAQLRAQEGGGQGRAGERITRMIPKSGHRFSGKISARRTLKMASARLRLGVNIDHVATIRNARGGRHPDPVRAAKLAIAAGADGITAHLREDRRHIRDDDIARLKAEIDKPLNFEMAATAEMLAIALKTRPHAACLVPEKRTERTTEGGLDAAGQRAQLAPVVRELKHAGIRVSLFIAAEPAQIEAAAELGAPVVEMHTGAWCDALAEERAAAGESRMGAAPRRRVLAKGLGLEVHAGHGLDYASAETIAALPQIVELNIGHFLIGEAVFEGLAETVKFMRAAMDRGGQKVSA